MGTTYAVVADNLLVKVYKQFGRAYAMAYKLRKDHSSVYIRDNWKNKWIFK